MGVKIYKLMEAIIHQRIKALLSWEFHGNHQSFTVIYLIGRQGKLALLPLALVNLVWLDVSRGQGKPQLLLGDHRVLRQVRARAVPIRALRPYLIILLQILAMHHH